MTEKYIVLDIWGTAEKWVNVVQGEAGARELKIKLVESGEEYDPTGLTARFYVSDGGGYNHFVDADINDGIISVIVPSGLAPGIAKAQVVLSDNDSGPLITVGLTLNVIPCTLEDAAEATDEWSPLIEALEKAEGAAEATDAANAAASAANAAAEAANKAADAANEAAESIADKVDTVDALPVYAITRGDGQDSPDAWIATPGIMVPDGGPYVGMAIRAVWKTKLDASVPLWSFTQEVPIKPEGTYPAGVYILIYDGEAWQLQADMGSVTTKVEIVDALPVHTMERQSGPDSWQPTPGIAVPDTGPYTGMAIRAVWEEEWDASVPIWCFGSIYGMQASGHHPAGTYILTLTSSYDWTVQPLDMAYTDERAEQAADEAAEAHAAQVRRTYQPAWKRTAGGCPVSVADAAEGADLSSLVLKGRTVVSGTPSPDAPVTITGVKPQTVAVTGKNLIPPKAASETINGVTCTVNADGSLTLNGTATATATFRVSDFALCPGVYTISSGKILNQGDNLILRKQSQEVWLNYAGHASPSQTKLIGYKGTVRVYLNLKEGSTYTNLTIYPQLEAGSEATSYKPYRGETITPDEVELYGDAHAVGKNLIPTFEGSASINGISVSINTDGSITLNGTATANTYINFPHMMIEAGTYTLSSGSAIPTGIGLSLREANDQSTNLLRISNGQSAATGTIAYNGDAYVYISINSGTTASNLTIYPQLEAGSKATAYEPYQGMTTALEDGDSLDLATGEVVRRWKRLELDGTEKWTIRSANEHGLTNFSLIMIDPYLTKFPNVYCTHYPTQNTLFADTTDRGILLSANYTIYIRETYTTVEDFKAYLAAQKEAGTPVTVLYRMKKPEVVSGWAHSLAQPEGEMVISALGNRGETVEAVDTEALYTYRPDWDDVLSRLAESEVQQAEMQTVLEQIQAKLAELTATE